MSEAEPGTRTGGYFGVARILLQSAGAVMKEV